MGMQVCEHTHRLTQNRQASTTVKMTELFLHFHFLLILPRLSVYSLQPSYLWLCLWTMNVRNRAGAARWMCYDSVTMETQVATLKVMLYLEFCQGHVNRTHTHRERGKMCLCCYCSENMTEYCLPPLLSDLWPVELHSSQRKRFYKWAQKTHLGSYSSSMLKQEVVLLEELQFLNICNLV